MSNFRFNFSKQNDVSTEEQTKEPSIEWFESEEVIPSNQIKDLDEIAVHANMFAYENVEIGHVVPKDVLAQMNGQTNTVLNSERSHSDLVTGQYEGGLKVWECTSDLIEYLVNNNTEIELENKNILDLGCGAGLLGIHAFMNRASVTFQDYNKEVIEFCTIPNVLLNIENEDEHEKELQRCKFYYGDWASFNNKLNDTEQYDIILTSETIYNPENYTKLVELFTRRLNQDGCVYIAAKTHYFGVGGGTRQFEDILTKHNFKHNVVWESKDGIKREIIKVVNT